MHLRKHPRLPVQAPRFPNIRCKSLDAGRACLLATREDKSTSFLESLDCLSTSSRSDRRRLPHGLKRPCRQSSFEALELLASNMADGHLGGVTTSLKPRGLLISLCFATEVAALNRTVALNRAALKRDVEWSPT